jgi:MFS family permease
MVLWPCQVVIGIGFALQAAIAVPTVGAGPGFLVVAGAAWLAQWAMTWAAYRAFLARPWWRRHAFGTSLVLLVVITIAAVVSSLAFAGLSSTDGWTALWRWLITLLATALLVTLADYRDDMLRERRVQEELREARQQAASVVRLAREEIVERLLGMLREAFDATSPTTSASDRLERFAREQVRPLSHELAEAMPPLARRDPGADVRSSWREVLSDVTSRPLIRPWAMTIVVTLLYVFTTVEVTSASAPASPPEGSVDGSGVGVSVDLTTLLPSLLALSLVFVMTLAVSWAAVRITTPLLPRLGLGMRVLLAILTVLAVAFAVTLVVYGTLTATGVRPAASRTLAEQTWVVFSLVAIAFIIVITRSITSLLRQSTQRLRDLTDELEWETTRLHNAVSQERQFFATQLHGPIQSAAAAAALRLHDSDASAEALHRVESDLRSAVEALGHGPPKSRDLPTEVGDLMTTWSGVCEVTADLPDAVVAAVNSDWICVGTVRDLLIEAVANAAMHGRATTVRIEAACEIDGEAAFTITDDGTTAPGEERGLGSSLLDMTCVRWSRTRQEQGVRLDAVVAVPGLTADLAHRLAPVG